jgi:predicted CDP-diglyceride synthetase/phosphatidate cytidylyltransferase
VPARLPLLIAVLVLLWLPGAPLLSFVLGRRSRASQANWLLTRISAWWCANGLSFTRPNLPALIEEIGSILSK